MDSEMTDSRNLNDIDKEPFLSISQLCFLLFWVGNVKLWGAILENFSFSS